MLVMVWEYRVRAERIDEFEAFYRPDGPWGELFRNAPGFVSITLMKDLNDAQRFLIADRWTSEASYEEYKRDHASEYFDLSARGRRLYERETELGRFDFLD
jgi:heme-degrading monooxygenase HmoA